MEKCLKRCSNTISAMAPRCIYWSFNTCHVNAQSSTSLSHHVWLYMSVFKGAVSVLKTTWSVVQISSGHNAINVMCIHYYIKEATSKSIQTWHVLDAQWNWTKSVSLNHQKLFLSKNHCTRVESFPCRSQCNYFYKSSHFRYGEEVK